ncbi:MAG: helix-turn-helix domain-containing protein, partial [Bacilli bacterium]
MYFKRIRIFRKYRGITQKEFIDGICSKAYISRIENNDLVASSSFLVKISEKYKFNIKNIYNMPLEKIIDETKKIFDYRLTNNNLTLLTEDEIYILEICLV